MSPRHPYYLPKPEVIQKAQYKQRGSVRYRYPGRSADWCLAGNLRQFNTDLHKRFSGTSSIAAFPFIPVQTPISRPSVICAVPEITEC